VARHAVDFWLSTEDLPLPRNRVTLREDGSIALAYTATNDVPLAAHVGQQAGIRRAPAPAAGTSRGDRRGQLQRPETQHPLDR
jgi:hypothetical protein